VRRLIAAASLALAACGAQHGGIDDGIAWGTVQSVKELSREEPYEPARSYDHILVRDPSYEIVVRLDSGAAVTATRSGARRFDPGERVRVLFDDEGVLLL
jgi:hypothetical protein